MIVSADPDSLLQQSDLCLHCSFWHMCPKMGNNLLHRADVLTSFDSNFEGNSGSFSVCKNKRQDCYTRTEVDSVPTSTYDTGI